MLGLMKQHKW